MGVRNVDLRKLRHAVTLAKEGSFAAASNRLCITQPALTRSIQALEYELNLQLFERTTTGVIPTRAGNAVMEKARALLRNAGDLLQDVELLKGAEIGNVAMGIGPVLAASLLAETLAAISRNRPRLQVHAAVRSAPELMDQLLDERIEFFVSDIRQFDESPTVQTQPLTLMEVGLFVRPDHPLLQGGPISHEAVTHFPLASPAFSETPRTSVNDIYGELERPGRIICDDVSTLKSVVAKGDAILLTSYGVVAEECEHGLLAPLAPCEFPTDWMADVRVISLAGRALSPAAHFVIEGLHEVVERLYPIKLASRIAGLPSARLVYCDDE